MNDGDALLNAILANSQEQTPTLMLADWLQENGAHELAVDLRAAVSLSQHRSVFLVTTGEYSDYRVTGVFSTRENAATFMEASGGKANFNDVEEYDLDAAVSLIQSGLRSFLVYMLRDSGDKATVSAVRASEIGTDRDTGWVYERLSNWSGPVFRVGVWARDEQHAVKIANEKRVAWLLNKAAGAKP